jgi:hypothetical protein
MPSGAAHMHNVLLCSAADVSTQFKACSTDAAAGQNPSMPGNIAPFGSRGAHRREPTSPRWSILLSSVCCCLFLPQRQSALDSLQTCLTCTVEPSFVFFGLQRRSIRKQKAGAAAGVMDDHVASRHKITVGNQQYSLTY